jgi:phosphoribosylformylglycinamidine synthase
MKTPKVLILHANGSNRDHEAAQAFELAGASAEIVHINQLRAKEKCWSDFQILALPGGFSYADALGAGKLMALDLKAYFGDEVRSFVDSGKPVIGICNGFQALVKSGILPDTHSHSASLRGLSHAPRNIEATLTFNQAGHFECRWITLKPVSQTCLWTRGLTELIACPIAHGEGNFILSDPSDLAALIDRDQVALRFVRSDGAAANGEYPINPNGSIDDIAGICNPRGNVLGLMPHPEDHIFAYQHPHWTHGEIGQMGLKLFENGVKYALNS